MRLRLAVTRCKGCQHLDQLAHKVQLFAQWDFLVVWREEAWISVLLPPCPTTFKTYLERRHVAKQGVVLLTADVDLLLASMQ